MPEAFRGWTVDHRIPLALLLAIAVQTAGIVWWGASLSASVAEHTKKFEIAERIETRRAAEERSLTAQIARIEAGMGELTRTTTRIENALNRQPPPNSRQ